MTVDSMTVDSMTVDIITVDSMTVDIITVDSMTVLDRLIVWLHVCRLQST